MTASLPALSVVIPFYNEEAAAFAVADEVCVELQQAQMVAEVILVDDGSTDRTASELERVQAKWPQCRVVTLATNSGQGAALLHGFEQAQAPIIAMMDGDGQNVPADILRLLPLLEEADLVVGVRVPRHDSWLRQAMSRVANRIRARVLRDGVRDAGCALKVFRRDVLESLFPVHMLNPFMPAFATAAGFRVVERDVSHRPRRGGSSKYGGTRLWWRPCFDMLAIAWLLRRSARRPLPRQTVQTGHRL